MPRIVALSEDPAPPAVRRAATEPRRAPAGGGARPARRRVAPGAEGDLDGQRV